MMIEEWGNKSADCEGETNMNGHQIDALLKDLDECVYSAAPRAAELIRALLAQLPEGMKHCTFQFIECKKGHGRLTATNWVDRGCPTCEIEDLRAKAFAAVWLLPEDVGVQELLELREEAREVFMGKDKQVIAKLTDELHIAQAAYRNAVRPPRPGVNIVYGTSVGYKDVKHVLMITAVRHAANGGLDIEVQLP